MYIHESHKPFTFTYTQPHEYRFSLDSIELPKRVAQIYRKTLPSEGVTSYAAPLDVLDLCSGCGVIGFEFQHWYPHVASLDFVDVQNVYESYFYENIKITGSTHKNYRFLNLNYDSMLTPNWHGRYNLILCNPPFFRMGMGLLSHSDFKNRCRFLIDSDFKTLIEVIAHTLKPEGEAYVLIRGLHDHKIDQMMELRQCAKSYLLSVRELEPVRGTPLVCLKKLEFLRN